MLPRRKQHGVAAVTLLLAFTPGCSWLSVRGPVRPADPGAAVACTESRAAPVGDTVLALATGLNGIGAVGAAAAWKGCTDNGGWDNLMCMRSSERTALIAGGVALLAAGSAFAFSAASGYRATRVCREVHLAQRDCTGNDAAACAAVTRLFDGLRGDDPTAESTTPCVSDRDCIGSGTCKGGTCGF